jgi:aminoglycoside 6'-N-acetyltransferase
MTTYAFRPAIRADLPMLRAWLETPEVVRWWGDPAEQYALLDEDLGEPLMTMLIVSLEGCSFAYAQHYDVRSWPQDHFAGLVPGARAIDAFIGEPAMIGRGHGAAFLRALAEQIITGGAPLVAIDPDAANIRARNSYRNAGFKEREILDTDEGKIALMLYEITDPDDNS